MDDVEIYHSTFCLLQSVIEAFTNSLKKTKTHA